MLKKLILLSIFYNVNIFSSTKPLSEKDLFVLIEKIDNPAALGIKESILLLSKLPESKHADEAIEKYIKPLSWDAKFAIKHGLAWSTRGKRWAVRIFECIEDHCCYCYCPRYEVIDKPLATRVVSEMKRD